MSSAHVDRLREISKPGLLGFATHCEVTEIFANVPGNSTPQNVLTVAVFEGRPAVEAAHLLNPGKQRLKIPPLKDWSFGIERAVLERDDFLQRLDAFALGGPCDISGELVGTASLQAVNPQFVSADWSTKIPLNRALKNNFWSGSYVFEWADPKKTQFDAFFKTPEILSELSQVILPFAPIDLSALSDRLGNILVQLPITLITAKVGMERDRSSYQLQIGWHPKATERPLRAVVSTEFDETITGFASTEITGSNTTLPYPENSGPAKATIWDDANNVILSTTAPMRFIEQIALNMQLMGVTEPRTFTVPDSTGTPIMTTVPLKGPVTKSSVGKPRQNPNGNFTQDRLYKLATDEALKKKKFVLYGTDIQDAKKEHQTALGHLRELIRDHGEAGTWLWDPYLTAAEVLDTLFYSPHSGADLRALCSAEKDGTLKVNFVAEEQAKLKAVTGNLRGLKLEFRAAHTLPNINFHDRFLIFPREDEGALAWSLGTSVNTVGVVHHILQQVDDGQRVADAFDAFWKRLAAPHLVWKHP